MASGHQEAAEVLDVLTLGSRLAWLWVCPSGVAVVAHRPSLASRTTELASLKGSAADDHSKQLPEEHGGHLSLARNS